MKAARDALDAAKEAIRGARTQAPRDLYALGTAARGAVGDKSLAPKLAYASEQAMWNAELPHIGADSVLRSVLFTRLVDEAGVPKPAGGLPDMNVEVERPGGRTAIESFRRLSLEDLAGALALAKKKREPPLPPPPAKAPEPAPVVAAVPSPVPVAPAPVAVPPTPAPAPPVAVAGPPVPAAPALPSPPPPPARGGRRLWAIALVALGAGALLFFGRQCSSGAHAEPTVTPSR